MFLFLGNTYYRILYSTYSYGPQRVGHDLTDGAIRSAVYSDILNIGLKGKSFILPLYYNYSFSISLGCLKIKNIQRGEENLVATCLKPQVSITEFTPNRK